jgi:8-oxo-dGTP pyrophosphatase MutT (NUDIX family)
MNRRKGGAQFIPRPPSWALGDLVPPRAHPLTISVADIAATLTGSPPGRPLAPGFSESRPSAVLVALADGALGAEVLLTRRSMALTNHRGEVSFPGGRLDPGEAAVDAALREAHEEVGLEPASVEVIGELDHFNTVVSLSYIVPVVARLPAPLPLASTSAEVDRVFWLPLAELVRPDTYRSERWGAPPADRLLHFFELDDETVWGVTAAILIDLLSRG